jgi:hypothetical protein
MKTKKRKATFREEERKITFTCPKRGQITQIVKIKVYDYLPASEIKPDELVRELLEKESFGVEDDP